jgi:hypothetical protein
VNMLAAFAVLSEQGPPPRYLMAKGRVQLAGKTVGRRF